MKQVALLMRGVFAAVAVLLSAPSLLAAPGANANAGARIANAGAGGPVPACASCHGAKGEGAGAFPHLAGTGAAYLREQLEAFATGARRNAVMQPIAKGLSPQQRDEVAAYYASLPHMAQAQDRRPSGTADRGALLATRGRWGDELPACSQCHGPGGMGVGPNFPPLAGQPAEYIAEQLRAWCAGSRPAGPLGLMAAIARKLDDADIQAVSDYYSDLAKQGAPKSGKATQ